MQVGDYKFLKLNNKYLQILTWALSYPILVGALQLLIPYPFDRDTAYHAVVGQLTREYGILHSFPWTPFSLLSDQYADKELLFHLLFVPFAGLNWITASHIVGTISGSAILLTLYLILRAENVRYAGWWSLVTVTSSILFLFRFVLVRPHLLSITLALIILWAASRQKFIVLAIASAIFPWAYVAFWQLPLLLLLAAETSRLLTDHRVSWKPAAVVIGGVLTGIVCHPNAVNLLAVNWMHMSEVLFKSSWVGRTGFDMGAELAPYPLAGWVQGLIFNVLFLIVAVILAWRNRKENYLPLVFAVAASGFCILTIKSARFAEYFVPFSVAAIALSIQSIKKPHFVRILPLGIICVTVLWVAWVQPNMIRSWKEWPNEMPPEIAAYLQSRIPPREQVFTPDWDQTGLLMLTLPNRRFMVQLDPTFFYLKNSDLYRLWYQICHDAPPNSAELIKRHFGARYVLGYNFPYWKKIFDELSMEPGVQELLVSDTWVLFYLGP